VTLTLGIETSCDETSAAVVEDGRLVHSNVVSSQIALHAPFGGVVPEIASRQHIRSLVPVIERALEDASVTRSALDAVAATQGPGLAGALLVGFTFARTLALALGLPFVPVNHLEGHLHSVWLGRDRTLPPPPQLPMLALIVSGGHTELVLMLDHGQYRVVGRTLDDAAGEAFDKVARLLGLPYPGGPAIEKAARDAVAPVYLPRAWLPGTFNFSFSGLKTAVLHLVYETVTGEPANALRGTKLPQLDVAQGLSPEQVANIAAGFQESVIEVLAAKTAMAAAELGAASIAVVGGVAASGALRQQILATAPVPAHIAPREYCTDNGAMIAAAGFYVPGTHTKMDVLPSLGLSSVS
jgi:tRNA N6-adenosine threonylcarbamoyltransferase